MTSANHLTTLEHAQLIRLASTRPDLEYFFRHALIHDVAYGSLVKRDRQDLHLAAGEILEQQHAERPADVAPVLGRHFAEAGDDARALRYFELAGDIAASTYANLEAADHYGQALAVARRARIAIEGSLLKSLYLKRGQALHSAARYPETWQNYLDMQSAARVRGDRALELHSLIEQATLRAIYSPIFEPEAARAALDQALTLAQELTDREAEARILWTRMRLRVNTGGDPARAIADGERSLAVARTLQLEEQVAFTLNDLQYAYRSAGQPQRALEVLAEARALWRQRRNQHMLADNLNQAATILGYAGQFEQALALTEEAYQVSLPSHNLTQQVYAQYVAGRIHRERGDYGAAIPGLLRAAQTESAFGPAPMQAVLAAVYESAGALEQALALARSAYITIKPTPLLALFGWLVLGVLARLLALSGQPAEAEPMVEEARAIPDQGTALAISLGGEHLRLAEGQIALAGRDFERACALMDDFARRLRAAEGRALLPEALYLKSLALIGLEKWAEAHAALSLAAEESEAIGARRMAWPVLLQLSRLDERGGDRALASARRQRARDIVAHLAEHAGSAELRATFLALPDVRELMEAR